MQTKKSRRKTVFIVLLIALVVILLAVFIDFGAVLDALQRADYGIMAVGALILLAGFLMISLRWRYLLGDQVEFLTVFNADSISYMIRMVTPIFLPVLRVVTTSKVTPLTISQVTPAMMADRMMETVMRIVALVLAAIMISTSKVAPGSIIFWILLLVGVFALIIRVGSHAEEYLPRLSVWLGHFRRVDDQRIKEPLSKLGEGLKTVGTSRRMFVSLMMSLLMWGCWWIYYALMFEALNFGLEVDEMLALSASILVVLPPSSTAMIGVFQGTMVALLLPYGVADSSTLTAYAILVFLVMMVLWAILGIWGLRRTHLNIREIVKFEKNIPEDDSEVELPTEA